ncbi:MAG: UvrD-helicase domain-containing protein [Vicinamibacteria bacterium]
MSELAKVDAAYAAPALVEKPFIASRYQEAILEWARTGTGHARIEAVAGSGKSRTLIELAKLLRGRVLLVAFNKSIATELQSKLAPLGLQNVSASTIHSLGYSSIRRAFGRKIEVDGQKLRQIVDEVMGGDYDTFYTRRAAEKLASLVKLTLTRADDREALQALMERYDVDANGDSETVLDAVPEILSLAAETKDVIDFDDMVWFPRIFKLTPERYDWLLVDESQDLNAAQREVVLSAVAEGGRVICVGDSHQAIYGFAGADVDSIRILTERLSAQVLPLSICYRCPKSHIVLAKEIVPQIEAAPAAPEGVIATLPRAEAVRMMEEGDMVLCRVNAPLAEIALELIRGGKKAVVRGRDISSSLLALVKKQRGAQKDLPRLIAQLSEYRDREVAKLQKAKKESQADSLRDRVETLFVLADGITSVEGLVARIESIFSDAREGVVCSSVHRAKGLEAERVFIYRQELMPHPKALPGWQMEQEWNLRYVALTRSKRELYFVAK